ncbi:unnamed protein product [Rotaria sp. Silwood2]|nr:unnamed protein product [Rotaria sp. Silwood2]CAF2511447.1 unnamed protein product [Rotaria sp. Silwood2]CAF2887501.1 unnamed protein product [Rotaria sp. Silwood2]CAF4130832.1 unnamed protein product [Rotaria sp. Silwood2]CAF4153582.1 unnamed protein product [Rotaria sp. Silwood2]
MKADNEQIILSHQLRTWSAVIPKSIILDERVRRFRETRRNKNNPDKHGSSLKLNSNSSTDSLSKLTTPKLQPPTAVATTNIHRTLDFSEFSMSHDDLCGMALTQSFIYLATKYEVRVVSLEKKAIIAQYGTEGNGPNQFKHISYLYIPHNDETNLYIVDRGQYCVQQYKIDSNGLCFEYVQQYVVIANVSERYNLVSCVIFNQNLYVSDDANYCLHRFRLNAARQSFYFVDNSVNPISPGSLCVHDKYLYVAVRSLATLSIVVFNEQCEIVDWFRNPMIQEILAMDISSDDNELYILTTTQDENDNKKKRLAIISMDLVVGPQK